MVVKVEPLLSADRTHCLPAVCAIRITVRTWLRVCARVTFDILSAVPFWADRRGSIGIAPSYPGSTPNPPRKHSASISGVAPASLRALPPARIVIGFSRPALCR